MESAAGRSFSELVPFLNTGVLTPLAFRSYTENVQAELFRHYSSDLLKKEKIVVNEIADQRIDKSLLLICS